MSQGTSGSGCVRRSATRWAAAGSGGLLARDEGGYRGSRRAGDQWAGCGPLFSQRRIDGRCRFERASENSGLCALEISLSGAIAAI